MKLFFIPSDGNSFFLFWPSKHFIWDTLGYSFVPYYIHLCIWIIFFIWECKQAKNKNPVDTW